MPTVVNIYTTQKKKDPRIKRFGNSENDPFFKFFEQFDFPFEELYQDPQSNTLGSGFIIDAKGHIVTNHHLIKDADEISVKLNDNSEFKAKLIGSDQKTDLALLKIEAKTPLPFVQFGDSSKSRVGDWVIAIGNSLGLGGTVTTGIISSKGRDINTDGVGLVDNYIQTDAAINMGNSGGPMFDIDGKVIGVNTALLSSTGTNIGIGFAIPSNTVQHIISELKAHGKVSRGFLNIKIQPVTKQMAEAMNLKTEEGVLVVEVDPSGAGHKAGLKSGDIIIKVGGSKVKNSRKLQIAIAEIPVGSLVKLTILRQGKVKHIESKLTEPSSKKSGDNIISSSASLKIKGIEFIDDSKGIIVVSIKPDAKWQGLRRGDIILSVNQHPISKVKDFKGIYDQAKNSQKKHIVLFIKRHNSKVFMALPI